MSAYSEMMVIPSACLLFSSVTDYVFESLVLDYCPLFISLWVPLQVLIFPSNYFLVSPLCQWVPDLIFYPNI